MAFSEKETSRNMLINLQVLQSARCNDVWSTDSTTTKQCSSNGDEKITGKDNSSVVVEFVT